MLQGGLTCGGLGVTSSASFFAGLSSLLLSSRLHWRRICASDSSSAVSHAMAQSLAEGCSLHTLFAAVEAPPKQSH
eukprot:1261882-Pyramimonas_sp.AAC.1